MVNRTKWIKSKIYIGWMLLALGILVAVAGIITELQYADQPYNFRIVTGLGILFIGIGVGNLVRYGTALKNEQSARRLIVEEADERTVLIRTRAGNRAYWVSAVFIYIGLMWASFAVNGDLPALEAWWGAKLPPPPGKTLEQRVQVLEQLVVAHGWTLP